MRVIAALGAVFFAAVGVAACGGVPGDAVVQVNGTPITKAAFGHWMGIAAANATAAGSEGSSKPAVPKPPDYKACIEHLEATQPTPKKGESKPSKSQLKSQCKQQYEALKQEVLGFLISTEWVMGEAEEQKISVSKKEVEKEFNTLKKQQFPKEKDFEKFLSQTGYTVSDLLLRVKVEMLSKKIREKISKQAEKPVTKKQIKKYYEEHKSQYGQPERRNLNIILTKSEAKAQSAKSEIESGQSFASVAKRVSEDPVSKAKGGALPDVTKGQEEKALDEAAFSAETGVLSGPVKTPFGYYVFEVTKIMKAQQEPLSKVESTIKQQLSTQTQQQAFVKFVNEYKKRWKARTECRPEYTVEDCKNYKKPKTTTTPPVPTTTSTATSTTSTTSSATSSATSSTKSK